MTLDRSHASITRVERHGLTRGESLSYAYAPAAGVTAPDGSDPVADLQTLSRSLVNAAGQTVEDDAYFDLPGLAYSAATPQLGTANVNYYATLYAFDDNGNPCKTVSPTGTITRTVSDGQGRVMSTWVGTNDTPDYGYWSPSNPAAMTMVSQNVYDGGGSGDSDLTQTTLFPGGSQAPRITQSYFDWRDRQVAAKAGVPVNSWDGSENLSAEADGTNRPIDFTVYDNLGEAVEQDTYTGDGVAVTTTDGTPDAPDAGLLRARTTTSFDEQGDAYRTSVYSVDPASGSVGGAITTDTFRDSRGDAVATYTGGSGAAKSSFDGVGRVVSSYATDGGAVNNNGTPLLDYAHAATVADDVVLGQSKSDYDADGNTIETISSDRLPADSTSATGALGDNAGSGGPAARVSYAAAWFDAAGRATASETVGTNGGSAWSRPASPDARDDTHLVSSTTYNAMGLAEAVTDPRNIVGKTLYDNLGRTTTTIAAYTGIERGSEVVCSRVRLRGRAAEACRVKTGVAL